MTYECNPTENCPLCGDECVVGGSTDHFKCWRCTSEWKVEMVWTVLVDNTDQLEAEVKYNIAQHLHELMEESDNV